MLNRDNTPASSNYGEGPSNLVSYPAQSNTLSVDESLDKVVQKINEAENAEDFGACLSLCSQAIKIHPKVISFAVLKAKFLVLTYQPDEANAILQEILRDDSQNGEAISNLGLVFYYQGNLKKSVEVFSDALQINNQMIATATLRKKAMMFLQIMGQIPDVNLSDVFLNFREEQPNSVKFTWQVMNSIEEGLKIDVSNREVMKVFRFKQAIGNFMNKDYQKAIKNITEALKFDETNLDMFMLRALCYIAVSFLDDAMIDLLEADKLNDNECSKTSSEIMILRKKIGKIYVAKTNYDFLEVPRNATDTEIDLSFKSLSLLHQLNLSKAATEAEKRKLIFKFKRVENAFAIFSDKKFKKQYDKLLKKQEAEIECPSLRTCCINFSNCYQCFCGATGTCMGDSCKGFGSCMADSCKGIGSCIESSFKGLGRCIAWTCSKEVVTNICCFVGFSIIVAIVLFILYVVFSIGYWIYSWF